MNRHRVHIQWLVWLLISTSNFAFSNLFAQGTALTYQGRLVSGANAANGTYDLRFILYNSDIGGGQQGPILTNTATPVNDGLFTVALDFANVFDGSPRWLEIWVRTNGTGSFTPLSPRQPITPAPYAITAENISPAALAGGFSSAVSFTNAANNFAGNFAGNGAGLTNVSATTLGGLTTSNFWKIDGNAGTAPGVNFLGTTDNQPLELKAGGQRALRLEPVLTVTNNLFGNSAIFSNSPNVLAGSPINKIDPGVAGATISGGGLAGDYVYDGTSYVFQGAFSNHISASFGAIGGGILNSIETEAIEATIAGGGGNTIQAQSYTASIAGGELNIIQTNSQGAAIGGGQDNDIGTNASEAVIAGGLDNTNRGPFAFIGGGVNNLIDDGAYWSAILGGDENFINGGAEGATVAGGLNNQAASNYSFAAGRRAKAMHQGTFVWADSQDADFSSSADNQFLIRAGGGVGIGTGQTPLAGMRVHSGGLAVTGQSSPNYGTAQGVFIEGSSNGGVIFAFDYAAFQPKPLALNSPGGNVGIGTATPTFQLQLSQDSAGKPNGGTWANTSDRRVKKNIEPMRGALDKLMQLRGVTFEWINPSDHANQTNRQGGFVAQAVEQAFPNWVQEVQGAEHDKALTPNGRVKSMSLPFEFNALSVEAMRELRAEKDADLKCLNRRLQERIDANNNRIETLEKEVAELKAMVVDLRSQTASKE